MELSDPRFGKIALHVFGFSMTDRKVHILLLSGLYASSLGNGMNQLHRITAIPHTGEAKTLIGDPV